MTDSFFKICRFSLLLCFSFPFLQLKAESALDRFVNSENFQSANISVLVVDVETGKPLADYLSKSVRNPASVTKLLTTASALEMLSDTFCFSTTIEYDGSIKDSVLYGNIYIRGGGDPTLESVHISIPDNFYINALQSIQQAGIKRIKGRIIGDASLFQEDGAPFHWLVEDIGSSYSPTPSALSIHDNLLEITLQSNSSEVFIEKIKPYTSLYAPKIEMTNLPGDISWRVTKSDFSWTPIFRGNIPMKTRKVIRTEIPEPALFAADSLSHLLQMVGISVESGASSSKWESVVAASRTRIYEQLSLPLKKIVQITNHQSNNLYAENIFRVLSLQKDSLSPCTGKTSAEVISAYWKEKGLCSDRIFQVDGSGLSMKNAISSEFLVQLLVYMKQKSPYSQSFLQSLPTAGKSGTVASFMKGTKLEGKAYVKSGSMERVQNYAGYISYNNKWYAFSVMVANFSGKRSVAVKQIASLLNGIVLEDASSK